MVTMILTNGAVDPQRRKLEGSGLLGLVDAALVSEEVGWHKPDARAFAAALTAVEGRPDTAAMVGDHLEADIYGALQAGFQRAVWLAPRWRDAHEDPRVTTVRRLDQVLTALTTVARTDREPGGAGRRARLHG
jgi:putative hydrolase of the HAD superfamily